MTYLY